MSHLRVRTIQLSLSIFDCSRPFISCLFLIVFFYFDFAPSPPRQFFSIRQRPPALRIRRRQLRKKERSSGISRRCKKGGGGGDRRANELIVIVGQAVDFILKVLIHHSGILQDPDSRHKGDLFVKEKGSRSKHLPQNPSVDRSSHPKAKARQQLFGGPSTDDRNNPAFTPITAKRPSSHTRCLFSTAPTTLRRPRTPPPRRTATVMASGTAASVRVSPPPASFQLRVDRPADSTQRGSFVTLCLG